MKAHLKGFAEVVALLLVLPALLVYHLARLVEGADRAFPTMSQVVALLPGTIGVYLRRAFYRCVLPRCGPGCCICFGVLLTHPATRIGRAAYLGPYCVLGEVTIEDDVLLGSNVSVTNGSRQHGIDRLDVPVREQPGDWPRVTIGRDSWVGDRAVVMADVGEHCVIGAGSVVTGALPDFSIAHGVPARVVGQRTQEGPRRFPPTPSPSTPLEESPASAG